MTLDQYLANGTPDYAAAQAHALVFNAALRDRLDLVQSQHGDPRHRVSPVALTDGRYMLNADVLTETTDGGIFGAGFSHLDQQLFPQVQVMPIEQARTLLPPAEEEQA